MEAKTNPFLVCDLRLKLESVYSEEQLRVLDSCFAGVGIDMEASRHLEVVPERYIKERVREFALEMSGLSVLPWCLLINEELVKKSCFYKVNIFGAWYFMHSSFYRTDLLNAPIYITETGVENGVSKNI